VQPEWESLKPLADSQLPSFASAKLPVSKRPRSGHHDVRQIERLQVGRKLHGN